jgi:epoxyqueuosine reductase
MEWLKQFGIVDFGYTEDLTPSSLKQYEEWVQKNHHYPLSYLADERKIKREHLSNFWSESQSALVFLFSYHQSHTDLQSFYQSNKEWNGLKLASFTLGFDGLDYHEVLKKKLNDIGEKIKVEYNVDYKFVLDTHPVLERDLAYRAGLGWFGKNSMLISKKHGSFVMIGSLLLNKKINIESRQLDVDHCGQCQKCVEACPTQAIDSETRTIKAFDCISTYTIEQFKESEPVSDKMNLSSGFIFGCDICQDVCPWNKRIDRLNHFKGQVFSDTGKMITDFFLKNDVSKVKDEVLKMSGGEFGRKFQQTSFFRSGKRGLLKNLLRYLKN